MFSIVKPYLCFFRYTCTLSTWVSWNIITFSEIKHCNFPSKAQLVTGNPFSTIYNPSILHGCINQPNEQTLPPSFSSNFYVVFIVLWSIHSVPPMCLLYFPIAYGTEMSICFKFLFLTSVLLFLEELAHIQ